METKKSIVTKVTKFDKKDNYGNYSFLIEFKNGDKGYYNNKDENQQKFVSGVETTYTIDEKVGKNGNLYWKLAIPGESTFKPGGGGKPQVEPRIQMISFAMSYCKDCIVAGKIPLSDLEKEFNRIYNVMISKL
jgi:hypothetical protein